MKVGGWMKKNRNIESENCLFVKLCFKKSLSFQPDL